MTIEKATKEFEESVTKKFPITLNTMFCAVIKGFALNNSPEVFGDQMLHIEILRSESPNFDSFNYDQVGKMCNIWNKISPITAMGEPCKLTLDDYILVAGHQREYVLEWNKHCIPAAQKFEAIKASLNKINQSSPPNKLIRL